MASLGTLSGPFDVKLPTSIVNVDIPTKEEIIEDAIAHSPGVPAEEVEQKIEEAFQKAAEGDAAKQTMTDTVTAPKPFPWLPVIAISAIGLFLATR